MIPKMNPITKVFVESSVTVSPKVHDVAHA